MQAFVIPLPCHPWWKFQNPWLKKASPSGYSALYSSTRNNIPTYNIPTDACPFYTPINDYLFLRHSGLFYICLKRSKLWRGRIFNLYRPLQTHQFQVRMPSYCQPGRKNIEKLDTYIPETKFFFFILFFFLLYNIVLVLPYINMHLPLVYTCSPSWTPLPPPSPYHPSGSSQCTIPKLPVYCIEPGLAANSDIFRLIFFCYFPT